MFRFFANKSEIGVVVNSENPKVSLMHESSLSATTMLRGRELLIFGKSGCTDDEKPKVNPGNGLTSDSFKIPVVQIPVANFYDF